MTIPMPTGSERYVEVPVRFPLRDFQALQTQCGVEELSERQLIRKAVRFYLGQVREDSSIYDYEHQNPHMVNVRVRDGIL